MKKIFASISASILLFTIAITALSGCNIEQGGRQASGSGELNIATFFENTYLELAARKYEEINDGVKITINVYATPEERDPVKYSQIINTALMSGGGEDIIDVSNLAWVTLADSNRLLDLNGKIDFASGDYYKSVLDAYLYNGGRYAVPLCFSFEASYFDESIPHYNSLKTITLDDLVRLAGEYPENPLISSSRGASPATVAFHFFSLDFNEFVDIKNKEANVDSEKFITLLEKVNSIAPNLRHNESDNPHLINERLIYNAASSCCGPIDYTGMLLMTNNDGAGLVSPFGFLPSVNANSGNQELAADFIQFLLSAEIQASPELMFNPVNKKASAEIAALILAEVRAGGYAAEDFDLENNIALFNGLTERLAVVNNSDYFINSFVREELNRYFDGEVSAEQAARNLQSRLNTYLKE
jgi:ABC-type glycerol-3-phosphate transport system substrate-binding protein